MNKRYIDFVPAKSSTSRKQVPAKKPVKKPVKKPTSGQVQKVTLRANARVVKKAAPRTTRTVTPVREVNKVVRKPVAKQVVKVTSGKDKGVFTPPKPNFINQNKVVKRPLSGNIYRKKVETAVAEKPQGPVTIISKPEKDRHVGVIVTIIIAIILGAAAGTVAFLLLPK